MLREICRLLKKYNIGNHNRDYCKESNFIVSTKMESSIQIACYDRKEENKNTNISTNSL